VITSVQLDEGANGAFHFKDTCPSIDGGRFPAKRIVGERAEVWADLDRDGHDVSAEHEWHRAPMTHHSGDRWFFAFIPEQACLYCDAIEAWTDEFAMWRPTYAPKRQAGDGVAVDTVEDAGMLTRAQAGGPDATAVNLRQREMFLQTGDAAALLTDELDEAMAEGQFRPDLMRPQPFPLVVDGVRACFGAWYEMVPRQNAALQQTSDLPLIAIDDANVITFVKPSTDQTNRVTVGFALTRDVHEFQLPAGETVVVVNGERRHSAPGEILVAGAQSALDRGGIKLRIEPDRDAALFFRCLA